MQRVLASLLCFSTGIVAGCATMPLTGDPAVAVFALAETEPVGTSDQDAADDPAIWRNTSDPAQSLVVATDKKAGLYVYGLDGRTRSFLPAGLLNNVDLTTLKDGRVLVAASDRTDLATAHILLAWLDTDTAALSEIGRFKVAPGEAYGLCMSMPDAGGSISIFSPIKDGGVYRSNFLQSGGSWVAKSTKLHQLASQPEGCVYDDRTDQLFVGEEMAGIWRFDLATDNAPRLVAAVDNRMLVADVEGLAIMPNDKDGGYLVASSQGDNAYAVFSLPDVKPVGRFRIAAGAIGATQETDGIELKGGNFGPQFPDGLFVAQDGDNRPYAQNFKLVSWRDIMAALEN
ncbi:phytase [Altererythrobacter sp. BO-6]|uniref:phytase n=1 Tax=Altererythrobacter sp. BO-6 TaxID=2604537 RepID=UPI0013E1DDCA|nr:phytase [Altererythrobacter sp. BO-6]QIG52974.1 phytase [Altererythrobacter sp. BO-6]